MRSWLNRLLPRSASPDDLLRRGWLAQQAGDWDKAASFYRNVIDLHPDVAMAYHLLGRLYGQQGRLVDAKQYLERAIALRTDLTEAWAALGNVSQLEGDYDQAISCYRHVLESDADNPSVLFNLARLYRSTRQPAQAMESLQRAVESNPDFARAWFEMAQLYKQEGRLDDALHALNRVVELESSHANAWFEMATVHLSLNQTQDAISACEQAISAQADHADAYYILGGISFKNNELTKANDYLQLAVHYNPEHMDARVALGRTLLLLKRYESAEAEFRTVLDKDPRNIHGYLLLSEVLFETNRLDAAHDVIGRGLRNCHNSDELRVAQSLIHRYRNELDSAERILTEILENNPDMHDARVNLGIVRFDQHRYDEALEIFDHLIAINHKADIAYWNKSHIHLLRGEFQQAWSSYGKRWLQQSKVKRPFRFPPWNGEELSTETLLIYAEQGLGDEILFASCLAEVRDKVKRCIIECDQRLESLFSRSFPWAIVHGGRQTDPTDWLSALDPVDRQIAIGDLPSLYRNSIAEFPQHSGYLRADPERITYWRSRLNELGPGLKVGVSWRGGLSWTRKAIRSTDLKDWLPILSTSSTAFVSLQYTDCQEELRKLHEAHGVQIHHWKTAIDDYDETAALVCALDLVISVCTSVVSLCGALGQPVWVMVPHSPGWMFMAAGEKTPWLPSARLYRQREPNDWHAVIADVATDLRNRAALPEPH